MFFDVQSKNEFSVMHHAFVMQQWVAGKKNLQSEQAYWYMKLRKMKLTKLVKKYRTFTELKKLTLITPHNYAFRWL